MGGGGSEADEARLWAEAFPTGAKVAIWPFAQTTPEGRRGAGDWMTAALSAIGQYAVEVWTTPPASTRLPEGVDIIAIPGGNTFALLHELRSLGLMNILQGHIDAGGAVYGGSAGAILAGCDIGIAATADANDVGLKDLRGLNLVDGLDVLPHYTTEQEDTARAHAIGTGRSVLCLPETSGVISTATAELRNVGPSTAYIVHPERTETLEASGSCPP